VVSTRTLTNTLDILRILEVDRLYAAYAIGDLADHLFAQCQWAVAETESGPSALALTFSGLPTPAVFVMGEDAGIRALLRRKLRLPQVYLTLRPEHIAAVSASYRMSGQRRMWRMAVDSETFRTVPAPAVRLSPADLDRLNALYAWGGPGFFTAPQLEHGVYYAIHDDGTLVAAAGTHIVSPEYGIAAVGNVYTHPDYRNRGYARACTGAVVNEVLSIGCPSVVLNVRQDNEPAMRAYTRLGFRIHCPFIETPGRRWSGVEELFHRIISA
jgi:ribosomal protein S18 acetylase RimI-like enzyme